MIKKLLNPIANFDEKVLLGIGLVSLAIAIVGGYLLGFKFDAIFHIAKANRDWYEVGMTTLRSFGIATVPLILLGYLINKRTRIVDIVNTVLIANVPITFLSIIMWLPFFANILNNLAGSPENISPIVLSGLLLLTLLVLPLMVLCFIIYFNSYKTSTNMKEWYHIVGFVVLTILVSFTQFLF